MFVPVVRIRYMRVGMHHGLMHMGMTVRALRHGIVGMTVVTVIVAVRMLVLQPFMCMFMPM